MNQLHLLRLLIPTVKTTFKIIHPQQKETPERLLRKIKPLKRALQTSFEIESRDQLEEHLFEDYHQINPKQQILGPQTEEESQSCEAEQKTKFLLETDLKRNVIDHRIRSLQYEANSPCEDSMVSEQLKSLNAYTVSIFDGHGGPQLAEFSKQKINRFIDQFLLQKLTKGQKEGVRVGDIIKESLVWSYKKLEDSFFEIYEQHLKLGNKKIKNVGTCGITAIVYNDTVYVGNSGDSMGIFILSDGIETRSQKTNERLSLSNRAQRERVRQKWQGIDDEVISELPNNCFYLKSRLQPTRTIGDYYLKKAKYYSGQGEFKGPYLSCDPDISEFKLTTQHKYLVLASDGLWDILSKNQVMSSIMNGKEIDLNKTCYEAEREEIPYLEHTLDCVLKRCSEVSGKNMSQIKNMPKGVRRDYHDDITIAVINLELQI